MVTTILLFIPYLVHLVMDSIQIIWKKKFVKHFRSSYITAIAGVICTVAIYIFGEYSHWTQPPLAMLCFHFALFTISLNIVRMIKKNLPRQFGYLFYLNDPSDGEQNWWDKLMYRIPPPALLFIWVLVYKVGIEIAFHWDCFFCQRYGY